MSQTLRNLKVAHIIGHLGIGGAERHFVNLLNQIDAQGKWAILISPNREGPNLESQLDSNIRIERSPARKRSACRDILSLARILRDAEIDVVHTHMFWPSFYGVVAARIAGVPVIVTTEHGENRWKKKYHRVLERMVISRYANRRFCVSESILRNRHDLDGIPEEILVLSGNGTLIPDTVVPKSHFNPRPVIGTVGRIVQQKNYVAFVEAISVVRNRGYDVAGCIVGDGPLMADTVNEISKRGLSETIELPGLSQNVAGWLTNFDIYLITSHEEGQPVALLEAMSYGLPIISTDVGAISKTIEHGKEGLVVQPGQIDAIADAVCLYLDNREFALSCGAEARKRAIKDFSIEAVGRRYTSAYHELLDVNGGRPGGC